jgi:hypothetical protein
MAGKEVVHYFINNKIAVKLHISTTESHFFIAVKSLVGAVLAPKTTIPAFFGQK